MGLQKYEYELYLIQAMYCVVCTMSVIRPCTYVVIWSYTNVYKLYIVIRFTLRFWSSRTKTGRSLRLTHLTWC